jgi:dipeptidyl aminopeptidase/acylaminoacyl peptidase
MIKKISFLFLLLLSFSLIQAQAGLSADDVAKLQSVSSAVISSDGNWIAYTKVVPADPYKENKPARLELHLYNLASGQSAPFFTRSSVGGVAFRPGHNTVTFLARLEGDATRSLYEAPLAGGEAQKAYAFETGIASYQWSADGKQLAFIATQPKAKEEGKAKLPYQPILYEQNTPYSRAYLLNWDDKKLREVQLPGSFQDIQWSPDGKKLAVAVAPTPLVDDSYMKQSVHIVDARSLESEAQVEHSGKLGKIGWSTDGKRLAMIAGADVHDPTAGRLFVASAQGGKPLKLQRGFQGKFEDFQWVDANTIQFLASESTAATLGTIKADGTGFQRMKNTDQLDISSFSRAADGKLALLASSPQFPFELFLLDTKMASPKRLTDNNPWLAGKKLGRQEVITYKARDGLELEGMIIYPTDEKTGQRYPLITVVHGGPESHYRNGWLTTYGNLGQMAAAEGYLLFFPNYRGSTGRGLEFVLTSQGDPAGKEFDDIVDGVDYLIEKGLADQDKVGVTGGSYGGYATGWMATRYSDRFAAGVMFVGISNKVSKWGTTDIPEEEYLVHARSRIWEDYDFWLKRSPIYYADQCKTPLLIMHGAEDPRVHPSQSMELYRHIKTRTDTPVNLVLYPGEGHGNRNATARLDYSLRAMGWFNQYLKGQEAKP